MKGLTPLLLMGLQLLLVAKSDAVMCYSCDHVAHPRDCATVMQCAAGESCHVMGYAQPDGYFYFRMGCRASTACPSPRPVGKRDIAICNLCCGSEYCNRKLCESAAPLPGLRCLKCDTVEHPSHCGSITQCADGQSCVTREIEVFGEKRYSLGCAYTQGCIPVFTFRNAVERRGGQCQECCTAENCNRNLCKNTGTSAITQRPAVTAAPPVVTTKPPQVVTQGPGPVQTTKGSVVMTTNVMGTHGVGFCLYNGRKYQEGEHWVDGCKYNCTCVDASIGRLTCTDYCLTYVRLPSNCKLVTDPGECCAHPVCSHIITGTGTGTGTTNFTSSTLIHECMYKGTSYKQDQVWKDNCEFECTCIDASTGHYRCRTLCYQWTLPKECSLRDPEPGKCCKTPSCPQGYTINYPPGYVAN